MNQYETTYEYKDELLEELKNYRPIVHTNKEEGYDWLGDKSCSIEIPNSQGDPLFIDLEGEITISYGKWHCHYYYEDRSDYECAMEKVHNILENKDSSIMIYSGDTLFGSGSSLNHGKYSEKEAYDFITSFFSKNILNEFLSAFQENGVTLKVCFWNSTLNYDVFLDKSYFS